MTTDRTTTARAALALATLLAVAPRAWAGEPTANTIAVAGAATVKARPTSVVIMATLGGEAELAADARVKFDDAKKKVTGILSGLKNPDLAVDSQGSSIEQGGDAQQQMNRFNGNGNATDTAKPKVKITEQLKLTLRNADKLDADKLMATVLKTIDTARDAGLQVGPPAPRNYYEMQMQSQNGAGLCTFRIADVTPLQDQAFKAAVDDARRRAQRLADVSGVKLGRVVSVQEQGGTASAEARNVYYYGGGDTGNAAVTKEASISTLTDIPVTAKVYVQFEIEK